MKKSTFIITETILSIVLVASVASVAALAIDIKTGGSIIPAELYGGKTESSAVSDVSDDSKKEGSSDAEESTNDKPQSSAETSKKETSKAESSKQESSKQESSEPESSKQETSDKKEESKAESSSSNGGLILTQPANLKSQPKELTGFINDFGYGYENLGSYMDHLIVVDSDNESGAKVYCYQKGDNDFWWNIAGEGKPLTDKGFVGKRGPDFDIEPGSDKTPMGFYSLGEGFYIGEKPNSTYPMFEITDKTYWISDTKSEFYNTRIEGTKKDEWSKTDLMINSKEAYKYGIVVNYNTYNTSSKLAGSIFLCCGTEPTSGSIAVPTDTMKTILEWLDEKSTVDIYVMT